MEKIPLKNQEEISNQDLLSEYNNARRRNKLSLQESNAIYKRLMKTKDKSLSKIAKVKRMYKQKQFEECTYQPKINKSSSKLVVKKNRKNLSNRINEILEERERKRERIRLEKDQSKEMDLIKNCTFTPKINKKRKRTSKSRRNSCIASKDGESHVLKLEFNRELREKNLKKIMRKKSIDNVRRRSRSRLSKKGSGKSLTPAIKRRMSFGNLRRNQSKGRPRKDNRGTKTPTRTMLKANKRTKRRRKKPMDPGIFTKRSIVILNDQDEFEDLNVYLQKKKEKLQESQKIFHEFEQILKKKINDKEQEEEKETPVVHVEKKNHEEKQKPIKNVEIKNNSSKNSEEKMFAELEFKLNKEVESAKTKPRRVNKRRKSYQKPKKKQKNVQRVVNKENEPTSNLTTNIIKQVKFKEKEGNPKIPEESFAELSKLELVPLDSCIQPSSPLDDKTYLVINGEKIFFEKNTIDSIIDTNRIKKISQCFNEYI